jgi:hypothetical protein
MNKQLRVWLALALLAWAVEAEAACWRAFGKRPAPFGSDLQVRNLQRLVRSGKCRFYGMSWQTRDFSSGPTTSVLVYDTKHGTMYRVHHDPGVLDSWNKWTGVTTAALLADKPWDGFDCGYFSSGTGWVEAPAEVIAFVRKNGGARLANMLR